MKTIEDLKEEITRIKSIGNEGFDSDWVLRKFARDQALINIELIKPYTDKYDLIVRFLVTGKDARAAFAATYAATYAAYAAGDAAGADAGGAAFDAAYAGTATDYTKAIESLTTFSSEHLALCGK